ncbi:MAG: TonB-dependent receptor [Bacteroidota bacterium]
MPRLCTALVLATVLAQSPAAQPADTLALPTARVEATRSPGGIAVAPFSVAVQERGPAQRAAEADLESALRPLPGLFVADRQNPSLGERLIVRGQGYRSPFGVRGVQVVLDGVPLTLADGQATLGIVDPVLVRRAEIVRGPAGALWGNGSGGVLFLQTIPENGTPTHVRLSGGSDGFVRLGAEAGTLVGSARVGGAVSRLRREGYRTYSGQEVTRARGWADLRLTPSASLRLVAALEDAPRLEHPGALTAEQLAGDRRQPDSRFVDAEAGKDVTQAQAAATLTARTEAGALRATVYGLARDLDNPLPFGYIALDRLAGGTRVSLERDLGRVSLAGGVDGAVQRDDRFRSPNDAGRPTGDPTLDQLETVLNGAVFLRSRVDLGAGLAATAALRADAVRFSANDRLGADGDQSGSRTLRALTQQAGLTYRTGPALLFASIATGFETPTTTELVNRPEGGGGFNPDLEPQRTLGVEIGARGVAGDLLFDLALYAMTVRDGLAPFEGPTGQTFFANRLRTSHRGVETYAEWRPSASVTASVSYSWSRLRVAEGAFEGNVLPGVPEHRLAARVRLARGRAFAAPEVRAASRLYADDANTAWADPAVTVDLTLGHEGLEVGRALLLPFVRLTNVLDTEAVGSVAINAFGGRYFEPAPERAVVVGVSVGL